MRLILPILLLLGAAVAAAETVDELCATLKEAADQVTSYRYTMTTTYSYEMGEGQVSEGTTMVKLEARKQGEAFQSRMESTVKNSHTMGEQTTTDTSTSLTVNDGTVTWTEQQTNGMTSVTKTLSSTKVYSPCSFLMSYKATSDITVLPDAEVDGETCAVLEVRMRPIQGVPPQGHQEYYLSRKTGLMLKTLLYDGAGKVTSTTVVSDLELDPQLDDSRFTYTPPEGATVTDLTGAKQE
jgi:outer membrane lipoprotein-sorting protein